MKRSLALGVLVLLAGCGGEDELTIYLPQRLGPDGPPGQISRVLMPVERDVRAPIPSARQAVLELRLGPSPDERARGFADVLEPTTRLLDVSLRGVTATVDLAGSEPTTAGAAAIVYSVTEATAARIVRLRLDGRPCCAYDRRSHPIPRLTRNDYRGWSGEPCGERTWDGAVRCRGGREP